MTIRTILISLLTLCITSVANAKITQCNYSKSTVKIDKYEMLDILFKTSAKVGNPFDIEFNAIFTSPSGTQQSVPAFYNGNGEWRVRFSAEEQGRWSYTTQSEVKALSSRVGAVEVSDKAYNNRKGTIKPREDDPRYLVWSDGDPYFLLGFECDFLFTLDYHSPTTERLDSMLDRVKECAFNHIVMNLYANDVVWEKDPKLLEKYDVGGDESIFPFLGSNSNPDHSSLNVEFFKRFDRTMEALNDRNIISHLMIYVWNKNVSWAEVLSPEDNRYFEYVIKRYQAFPNLVWDISKEALYYGVVDDKFISKRIEDVREIDSYKRLITVHDIGYCLRNNDMIDIASSQNWKLLMNQEMLTSRERNKNKPLLNVEHGGYEECDYEVFCGNYINAEYCLRRNYESLFAGTYTTYYWQGCSWNVLIDDYDTSEDVTYRPKMEYFKYMHELFTRYPFHEFSPAVYLSNSGFCMANKAKDVMLFYMPKESYKVATGNITKDVERVSFQWFNTHTGEYSQVVECDKSELNSHPAWANPHHLTSDAVLIFKKL